MSAKMDATKYGFSLEVFSNPGRKPVLNEVYMTNSLSLIADDLRAAAKKLEEIEDEQATDAAQGALFDMPAPKPRSAIAEGR